MYEPDLKRDDEFLTTGTSWKYSASYFTILNVP